MCIYNIYIYIVEDYIQREAEEVEVNVDKDI